MPAFAFTLSAHLRQVNFTSTYVIKRTRGVFTPGFGNRNTYRCTRNSSRVATMATSSSPPDFKNGPVLLAKQGPNGALGDCPFSHYANLALRARGIEFEVALVDLSNKPQWFLDLNEGGSTPTYVDGEMVLKSSGDIVKHADDTGKKGSKLIDEDNEYWKRATEVTAPLFKAFVTYVKSKDEKDRIALDSVVTEINELLASTPGKFVVSDELTEIDINMSPKLHLITVAGKHYLGYEFSASCTKIGEYMKSVYDTEEWKATIYSDEAILSGWSKFFK